MSWAQIKKGMMLAMAANNGLIIDGKIQAWGKFALDSTATAPFDIVHGLDSPVWGFLFCDSPEAGAGHFMRVTCGNDDSQSGYLYLASSTGNITGGPAGSTSGRRTYLYGASGDNDGNHQRCISVQASASNTLMAGTWYWLVIGGDAT